MNKESEDNDTINQQQWWPGVTHRPGPDICSLIKIWLHKMSSVLMRSLSSPTRRHSTHLHSRRLISHLHNCHNRVHTRKSGSRNHLSNNDTVNTKFLIFFFFFFYTKSLRHYGSICCLLTFMFTCLSWGDNRHHLCTATGVNACCWWWTGQTSEWLDYYWSLF